jgi:predicted amidohydrolase
MNETREASLIIKNATILTMNDAFDVIEGDVEVRGGRIAAIGPSTDAGADQIIDAHGSYLVARFHPDAHSSLPDAVPRVRRRPRLARLAEDAGVADGGRPYSQVARRGGTARPHRSSFDRARRPC